MNEAADNQKPESAANAEAKCDSLQRLVVPSDLQQTLELINFLSGRGIQFYTSPQYIDARYLDGPFCSLTPEQTALYVHDTTKFYCQWFGVEQLLFESWADWVDGGYWCLYCCKNRCVSEDGRYKYTSGLISKWDSNYDPASPRGFDETFHAKCPKCRADVDKRKLAAAKRPVKPYEVRFFQMTNAAAQLKQL